MTRLNAVAVFVCAFALSISVAEAKQRHKHARHDSAVASQCLMDNSGRHLCPGGGGSIQRGTVGRRASTAGRTFGDPRPSRWCGWWLRQELKVSDRAGNLARWWARYGANAHGPAVGAIVVWPHHVGIITARTESGWVVKSGNDGHAVRERERSVTGAIAFRWPNQWASR